MINNYQNQLQEFLKASTVTPGLYSPSHSVRFGDHVAVMVDGSPILLTGPAGDQESISQAEAFVSSKAFSQAVKALDISGDLSVEAVSGESISWPSSCEAVVQSEPGVVESSGDGGLMTINLSQHRGLTTLLCTNTELARIIDPEAPEMCDGRILPQLAQKHTGTLKFH